MAQVEGHDVPVERAVDVTEVTIGRIVHYRTLDGHDVPAIVTRTRPNSGVVDLQVFHFNRGVELATAVVQSDVGGLPETWHWPTRT